MSERTRQIPWGRLGLELVVIVGGILIALGLESWWDGLADGRRAQEYLVALEAEIQGDIESLETGFLPRITGKLQALAEIAPVVRGQAPVPADTVAFLTRVGFGGLAGIPNSTNLVGTTTMDEMVATGALSLIESTALRSDLIAYYNLAGSLSARFNALMPNYPFFVHGYSPAERRGDMTPDDVRAFGVDRALSAYRSPEFETVMNQEYNYALYLQRAVDGMLDDARELTRSLRCARGVAEACDG